MGGLAMVVIGRNEGVRLQACLETALCQARHVVYVDSGSTDDSVELARGLGVVVIELDHSLPFTAGRGRNAGVAAALKIDPDLEFVQFIDGDCELADSWLDRGLLEFSRPEVAVVCGRRREVFPTLSIYHRLCDIEWDTPMGETTACGGDALMRVTAFREVGGFNPTLIAGEEPELCLRLRRRGWKIVRIDADMTRHDARMTRFAQWWRRQVRAGHAYAEVMWQQRSVSPEPFWLRETLSNAAWGIGLPLVALGGVKPSRGKSLGLLAAYPMLWVRIFLRARQRMSSRHATLYATFTCLGKFPQAQGMARFFLNRARGVAARIIEYKS